MGIVLMIIFIICIILLSIAFAQMFKIQSELDEIILKRIKGENNNVK